MRTGGPYSGSFSNRQKTVLWDGSGISIDRVGTLRTSLSGQLVQLPSRAAALRDPAFEEEIRELQAEHDKLEQVEQRVNGELDANHARRNLLDARETAAEARCGPFGRPA